MVKIIGIIILIGILIYMAFILMAMVISNELSSDGYTRQQICINQRDDCYNNCNSIIAYFCEKNCDGEYQECIGN